MKLVQLGAASPLPPALLSAELGKQGWSGDPSLVCPPPGPLAAAPSQAGPGGVGGQGVCPLSPFPVPPSLPQEKALEAGADSEGGWEDLGAPGEACGLGAREGARIMRFGRATSAGTYEEALVMCQALL